MTLTFQSLSLRRAAALVALTLACSLGGVATVAGPGAAAPGPVLQAERSSPVQCVKKPLPSSNAADSRLVTSNVKGIVQARLAGDGDWDLAIFDADTGRVVGGSAGFASNELAEGFVTEGERLIVQGCRYRGAASQVQLSVDFYAAPAGRAQTAQLVAVSTPTRADKTRLQSLGLDVTESGTATSLDVVLHGAADVATLKRAGLSYVVKVADLDAVSRRDRAADASYAATTPRSALPSGRTKYRHLWDYELEMKRLAEANPDLVRPLTLPLRTVEGRSVEGIEITRDAQNIHDGKPVFLQLGVHHAREWPSSEHVMEFAYDLLKTYAQGGVWADRIASTRTIIVPVVNPDGFNISREAPSMGATFDVFDYEYKRKNCGVTGPQRVRGGTCGANPAGRYRGIDLNRNYAGFWGGPGAAPQWSSDIYRGPRPFSEPESQNVRDLVSTRQVVTLITNHTFSDLILRPPGVYDTRPPLDDVAYERLGAALASSNGYDNVPSYQLYDTTGTTEDWSYWNTGGFGFTFEIGTVNFHPQFRVGVVAEYLGLAPARGAGRGGNRAAYFEMLKATADTALHSTLEGTAPAGTVLRVHKRFSTPTSPVVRPNGTTGAPLSYTDTLDSTYAAPGGAFRFAVNPSTRPYVAGRLGRDPLAPPQEDVALPNPAGVPDQNQGDPFNGPHEEIPFTVRGLPEVDNETAAVTIRWASPSTDWDLYILDSDGQVVAQSASGGTTSETARLITPAAGTYTAVVVNYDGGSADDWSQGQVDFASPSPTTYGPTETWSLTCETTAGRVLGSQSVFVARGQTVDVGEACRPGAAKQAALRQR